MKRILRSNEKESFEKEVVTALVSFNVVIPPDDPIMNLETKLVLLRQKIDNSNDTSAIEWADFDVDVDKYFEKQSDGWNCVLVYIIITYLHYVLYLI